VVDHSVRRGSAGRRFRCKAILLYWTGDYPAQAKVSGTHSKTCHWCTLKSRHAPEISRRAWDGFRRFLPPDHPYRTNPAFGPPEYDPPPAARTHEGFKAAALANEVWDGAKCHAPYKTSGVKELSPLAFLPLFCLIWDILPDMMHIILGIWKRHIMMLLAGKRTPAAVKRRKKLTPAENDQLIADAASVKAILKTWKLSNEAGETLDARSRALAGEGAWVRSNLQMHSKGSNLTAHDWMRIIQDAGDYVFHGMFPDQPERLSAIYGLVDATNLCLETTSAYDSENRDALGDVRLRVIEALSAFEAHLPVTERAVMFHIMVHVPDAIYRWNSTRNFWCYFGERMMGHLIRFIHNRDLAVENIVTAYTRMRLMLGLSTFNPSADTLLQRLADSGCTISDRSYLQDADEVQLNSMFTFYE
jgi:hypothetical protein